MMGRQSDRVGILTNERQVLSFSGKSNPRNRTLLPLQPLSACFYYKTREQPPCLFAMHHHLFPIVFSLLEESDIDNFRAFRKVPFFYHFRVFYRSNINDGRVFLELFIKIFPEGILPKIVERFIPLRHDLRHQSVGRIYQATDDTVRRR